MRSARRRAVAAVAAVAAAATWLVATSCGSDVPTQQPAHEAPSIGELPPAPSPAPPLVGGGTRRTPPAPDVATQAPPVALEAPEAEPNDAPRADGVRDLALGTPATGTLAPPTDPKHGDQDWWRLRVPDDAMTDGLAGWVVAIALEGPDDLDALVEWVPAPSRGKAATQRAGRVKAHLQADLNLKRPGPELLPSVRLPPGIHHLRVREAWYRRTPRKGSARPYRLHVTRVDDPIRLADAEPDHPDRPRRLELGVPASAWLAEAGDVDGWEVHVPAQHAGSRVALTVDPPAGLALRVVVSVAGRGTTAAELPATDAPAPMSLRHLGVPTVAAGSTSVLRVEVSVLGPGGDTDRPYRLRATLEPPEPGGRVEVEPNDQPAGATPLMGPPTCHGVLSHPGDTDRFTWTQPAGAGVLVASVARDDGGPVSLGVAPAGLARSSQRTETAASGRRPATLAGVWIQPGVWQLVVGRPEPRDPASGLAPATYTVRFDVRPPEGLEREPNGVVDTEHARDLADSGSGRGWLSPARDVDVWQLTMPGDEAGGGRIVTLRLEAADGDTLADDARATETFAGAELVLWRRAEGDAGDSPVDAGPAASEPTGTGEADSGATDTFAEPKAAQRPAWTEVLRRSSMGRLGETTVTHWMTPGVYRVELRGTGAASGGAYVLRVMP